MSTTSLIIVRVNGMLPSTPKIKRNRGGDISKRVPENFRVDKLDFWAYVVTTKIEKWGGRHPTHLTQPTKPMKITIEPLSQQ